jgi:hypothetical protein
MRSKKLMLAAMSLLAVAALVVPLCMKGMPLPVRLVAGMTNMIAAIAIGALLWQRRNR